MTLPGRDVPFRAFARALYDHLLRDNLSDYAASIAYSAVLAIFPFLLFVVALASLVVDPATVGALIDEIRRLAPPQAAKLIAHRLNAMTSGRHLSLVTVSAVGVIWTASGAVAALTTAFNIAYEVRETRPYWRTRGMAIVMTLAGAVLIIGASGLAVVATMVLRGLGIPVGAVVFWLRWPIAALVAVTVVDCLYYFLPNVRQPFRLVTPGSIAAASGWILASLAFSAYVSQFGRYEIVYGAVGSVIVLLLWLWISALVVLAGAEVNAVLTQLADAGKEQRASAN
jgi:membrane protein